MPLKERGGRAFIVNYQYILSLRPRTYVSVDRYMSYHARKISLCVISVLTTGNHLVSPFVFLERKCQGNVPIFDIVS